MTKRVSQYEFPRAKSFCRTFSPFIAERSGKRRTSDAKSQGCHIERSETSQFVGFVRSSRYQRSFASLRTTAPILNPCPLRQSVIRIENMPGGRFELPTKGLSVPCSTTELPWRL